jgi:hypothetical protein
MRKSMIGVAGATVLLALVSPAMAASSGTSSGSGAATGSSGSIGLGIDYAALVSAGATGNPGVALPGASKMQTLGGPINGLVWHFSKPYGSR